MELKPKITKVPAQVEPIEEEVPANVPENLLFGLLGAWCAVLLGLSLYQKEIREHLNINRQPASVEMQAEPNPDDFHPYENFP